MSSSFVLPRSIMRQLGMPIYMVPFLVRRLQCNPVSDSTMVYAKIALHQYPTSVKDRIEKLDEPSWVSRSQRLFEMLHLEGSLSSPSFLSFPSYDAINTSTSLPPLSCKLPTSTPLKIIPLSHYPLNHPLLPCPLRQALIPPNLLVSSLNKKCGRILHHLSIRFHK